MSASESAAARDVSGMNEHQVVALLADASPTSPLATVLKTDDRVLARVTDGIYRQPASALRELVANAYDADATRVTIRTDRPRFERITVEDNGIGMSREALLHLLFHIGGSAKRTETGRDLGLTDPENTHLSPGGRRLIGKIGIGLFSVAQLTQSFQIISKQRGDTHWNIASILLKQYRDSDVLEERPPEASDESAERGAYEAGKVLVWRQEATDSEAQGTSIVLTAIRPQTRETLRSQDIWDAVATSEGDLGRRLEPPLFHIGALQPGSDSLLQRLQGQGTERLPWSRQDPPAKSFERLVDAVWGSMDFGEPNPRITRHLDYYLRMAWNLGLAVPLPYVQKHPFDLTASDGMLFYQLDERGTSAQRIRMTGDGALRETCKPALSTNSVEGFQVLLDDLELRRPLRMLSLPRTSNALKKPLLFVAKHREVFDGVDLELSGGPLAFEAYFLWAPKIAPVESQGVLIRVHEASGTLFDADFLRFPVTERQRMAQISCEIFITEGFDGALNIDRESFNFAHPHVVALTKWLHRSLKTVIAEQKRLGAAARKGRRVRELSEQAAQLDAIVQDLWLHVHGPDSERPDVQLEEPVDDPGVEFDPDAVLGVFSGPNWAERRSIMALKLVAIAQILSAYELFDDLPQEDRDRVLGSIRKILQVFE